MAAYDEPPNHPSHPSQASQASDRQTSFWENPPPSADLSTSERELRDRFIEEYLKDYDQTTAAIRIGFPMSFARTYAERFMTEPYVRQKISEREAAQLDPSEEKNEFEIDRRRIRAALLREANYNGPGSSHSARVSALAKLASIRDMDSPIKVKTEHTLRGGVMMVPGIASLDEWEKTAQLSQENLKRDATD